MINMHQRVYYQNFDIIDTRILRQIKTSSNTKNPLNGWTSSLSKQFLFKIEIYFFRLIIVFFIYIKCPCEFVDIGSFGDMGTGRISAKNCEIA